RYNNIDRGIHGEEMIGLGWEDVAKALTMFKPTGEAKFTTYAWYVVFNYLRKYPRTLTKQNQDIYYEGNESLKFAVMELSDMTSDAISSIDPEQLTPGSRAALKRLVLPMIEDGKTIADMA